MIKELQEQSAAIMGECQNVLRQIIQNAFVGVSESVTNVKMQVDIRSLLNYFLLQS